MSADDVISEKKKKKSVKFSVAEDAAPKNEEVQKTKKKKTLTTEVDANEKTGKKRKRRERVNNSTKRRKLMETLVGPQVDKLDFETEEKNFSDFGLDERILKSVGLLGWEKPTQVQESLIGLALENKNVMARARTGSGKTGAYLLPIIHKLITEAGWKKQEIHVKKFDAAGPSAIVIAPTKELITQVYKLIQKLLESLPFLQAMNLCDYDEEENSLWMEDTSQFVVTTPGKLLKMISLRKDYCSTVKHLVLDEADLLLSFGYEKEMTQIRAKLPTNYQCVLTSATLRDDMTLLKKLFMTGPVVTVKLAEGDLPGGDQLTQYHVTCDDDEQRFAILVSLFKLKLIVGRTIVFVNNIDRCYKLSLVLRAFGLKSCILNSAMPANSRCHVINQFNDGLFPIVIASDVTDADGSRLESGDVQPPEPKSAKEPKKGKLDQEAGVSRGIDFHHVGNVINFDFPKDADSYIHRVGRTARGFNKGTALSFCTPDERPFLDVVQEEINEQMGKKVMIPYQFRIKDLDSFLLRTREALFKCTKGVIKKARIKEIKQELMRSANLKTYFAKNEREKLIMQTDCHPVSLKIQSPAMADVTDYMVPEALKGIDYSVATRRKKGNPGQRHRDKSKKTKQHKKFVKRSKDPLKSFSI